MRPGEPAEGSSRAGSISPQAIARRQLSYIWRSEDSEFQNSVYSAPSSLLALQVSIRYDRVTRSCKVDLNHTGLRSRLFQA